MSYWARSGTARVIVLWPDAVRLFLDSLVNLLRLHGLFSMLYPLTAALFYTDAIPIGSRSVIERSHPTQESGGRPKRMRAEWVFAPAGLQRPPYYLQIRTWSFVFLTRFKLVELCMIERCQNEINAMHNGRHELGIYGQCGNFRRLMCW